MSISNADYVALHNHGDTSFLDGRARHEEIVERAVELGNEAVSLTDHDEVNGHINMWNLCQKAGIKFVPGAEQRWLMDPEESRRLSTSGYDYSHICLLAENNEGLKNLWTLSSLAYEPGNFYRYPQLNPPLMKQYASGLWASDGCGLTRFAGYIEEDDEESARQEWAVLLDIFGDRFYSELHTFKFLESEDRPLDAKEREINAKITKMNHAKVRFAQEMGVPLVVVNDAHYAWERDWKQHRLVWKMNTKNKKDQSEGNAHAADWMMSADELVHYMGLHGISRSIVEEAVKNTRMIADSCTVEIKPTINMPRLHDTDEEDRAAFLRSCEEGFKRFVTDKGLDEETYRARLEREQKLIIDKDFYGYFNVVSDYMLAARSGEYIKWVKPGAKPKPCICGPGRGSGGGSLVNYLLGITSLDPIKYDLSFERFINPDRPDFPDIDVDFQKSHRKDLLGYMAARYGGDKVVAIGTKAKSGPARAIQDLCKALGIDFKDSLAMSKLIKKVDFSDTNDYEVNPDYVPPTWEETLELIGGELQPYMEKYADTGLFRYAQDMVGLSRQAGVHAAGIFMDTDPILGKAPTRRKGGSPDAPVATQFDMEEMAWLGAVKMDFLSNKGLDVLSIARDLIWERHGKWIDYDGFLYGAPPEGAEIIHMDDDKYADPTIWEQIDLGHTAGIFQINTPSGTKQAKRFKPRNLKDLADLVSVNRPGVLRVPGLLDRYMRRRHGEEEITYDHPLLEQVTGHTMGILVYQEDLVAACRLLANFTPGEGETLRKAIGKKKLDLMQSFKGQFLEGCMANREFTRQGGNRALAERIWQQMIASASYAFNKAHAMGYAMQAVQEIWVKAHYFQEFETGCLAVYGEDVKDGEKKSLVFLRECRRRKQPVLPPDVNQSQERFSLTDDGIRYGLIDINGIGPSVIPDIIKNRPYVDLQDYLDRTKKGLGGKRGVVDNLVKIGAFDWTGQSRSDMLDQVYYHWCRMEIAEKKRNSISVEETDKIVWDKWRKNPDKFPRFKFDKPEVVQKIEEDLVGTFITRDPMGPYVSMIEGECIQHPTDMEDFRTGQRFVIGGELMRIHKHQARNGEMAFLTVRWNEEDFEFLAFNDSWKACKPMLSVGAPVACEVIKLDGDSANLSTVVRLDWMD
ncbi:DNA polymerase III alpha subunit [Mycobacterium phage Myrna]|uniref:DNA-directed DNA polymerase n=1 Tax=Mycobacterium phage Myrna TaxID=546805 RepID=B5LJG4_9CAUD|nr:DNA polymerase [Mycobacterium phage Myrna]ACH62161.1 DNA polymerase III alpha subunit [Mycobacterium phage Myrna]